MGRQGEGRVYTPPHPGYAIDISLQATSHRILNNHTHMLNSVNEGFSWYTLKSMFVFVSLIKINVCFLFLSFSYSNGNTVVFANIDPPPYSARMPPPPTISALASQNNAYPPVPSNLYNQPQSNLTINLPPPVVRTPDQTTISALGLGDRRQERNNILPPLKGAGKF